MDARIKVEFDYRISLTPGILGISLVLPPNPRGDANVTNRL